MEFSVRSGKPEKQRAGCLVVGVHENRRLTPAARRLDEHSDGAISQLVRRGDAPGRTGATRMLDPLRGLRAERVLLVGLGGERDCDDRAYDTAVRAMVTALQDSGATSALSYLAEAPVKGRDRAWGVRIAARVVAETLYRFDQLKTRPEPPRGRLRRLAFALDAPGERAALDEAARAGAAIGHGVNLARDLGNLPASHCTPTILGQEARALAERHPAIDVEVLDEGDMEELGMHALLSVSRGSSEEARFIIARYRGADDDAAPCVLVGKGITFDSGGISLKPAEHMDEMKFDMCGAASVLGTLEAIARLEAPVNVVGLIAASENMADGSATRPGDVISTLSGQTVEVLNTDAEGRLVLCDALTYAERFEPAAVVDVATLTGAAIVALGHHTHAVLGNSPALVNELLSAGRSAADRAWELPMGPEYQEQLKSNFADVANIGGRPAGTITAACFLARFTGNLRWAHLDIAGTAWKSGKEKGATGRPVPLLTQWLLSRAGRGRQRGQQ